MDVAIEIPIDTCLSFFNFDSFIPGHHVYQHICTPVVGEKYCCIWEIENKQDKNAMAVSKYVSMFLSLPGSYLVTEVTNNRVNQKGNTNCITLENIAGWPL